VRGNQGFCGSKRALQACVRDALNFDPRYGAGQDAFDALQRLVDEDDPGYRR